ncbi:hypothetical protein CsSME_00003274 [Camellia sinensis var. sinensis]
MKRQVPEQVKTDEVSNSFSLENITVGSCIESVKRSSYDCSVPGSPLQGSFHSSSLEPKAIIQRTDDLPGGSSNETAHAKMTAFGSGPVNSIPGTEIRKKARQSQWSQLSLKSFFQKSSTSGVGNDNNSPDVSKSDQSLNETFIGDQESNSPEQSQLNDCATTQDQGNPNACCSAEAEKSNVALLEWQRIRQLMQSSVPLCKGHREPCVSRVVKKAGPSLGRRFYVCARAEGPASNPESNCGYFKWAASKPKGQR